jgi:hypothetical protein
MRSLRRPPDVLRDCEVGRMVDERRFSRAYEAVSNSERSTYRPSNTPFTLRSVSLDR